METFDEVIKKHFRRCEIWRSDPLSLLSLTFQSSFAKLFRVTIVPLARILRHHQVLGGGWVLLPWWILILLSFVLCQTTLFNLLQSFFLLNGLMRLKTFFFPQKKEERIGSLGHKSWCIFLSAPTKTKYCSSRGSSILDNTSSITSMKMSLQLRIKWTTLRRHLMTFLL